MKIGTRPDTQPPVADGWAGAEMRLMLTDRPTDQRTNGPTDQRTNGPTDKASYRVTCLQRTFAYCPVSPFCKYLCLYPFHSIKMRHRISIRGSVCPSVGLLVCRSLGMSVTLPLIHFFFYKRPVYKRHEAEICQNFKNRIREYPG